MHFTEERSIVTSPIFLHFCIDSDYSWDNVKSTERTSSCFSTSMFFHVTFRYYLRFLVDWNQCLDFLSPAVWSWPQWRWKGWGFCLFVFCLAFFCFFVAFFFDDTYFCEVIFLWEKKRIHLLLVWGSLSQSQLKFLSISSPELSRVHCQQGMCTSEVLN